MSSRARFRCWTRASALLAALCAGSVLLFSGADTSAWDTEGVQRDHDTESHAGGGYGWLIHKHEDITSNEEGPLDRRGCRALLDPAVNNSTRGPTSVPTVPTTIVPVTIVVDLGVNFRARDCVDFYVCSGRQPKYLVSMWDEDHHHGSTTGATIVHQSTYTIKLRVNLNYVTHRTGVNVTDAVDAGLTSACGSSADTFDLQVTINVLAENGDAVDVPTARWNVDFGASAASGCTASLPVGASGVFFDSRGAGRRPVNPSDLPEGSMWVLGLARVDDDGGLCEYTVTPTRNSKPHTPRPAFQHTLYPSPGGTPDVVCCPPSTVTVSDRHGRPGEEHVAFVYTIPSPPACPLASTFSGRLVSELTLDANGDGDVDEDDCWVWCPVPDGGTYVIPPNLPHMPTDGVRVGGVWLTETTTPTLTEAVAAWRASADCVPRPPKPLPAVASGAGVTPDNSSCPGGRRAFDDEVTMNVAASVRARANGGEGRLRIYALRHDDRRAVSNPDNVPAGEQARVASGGEPREGSVVAGGLDSFHGAFFDYVPHPWASGRDAFIYEVGPPGQECQAKVTVTFTDSPPQVAFAVAGDEQRTSGVRGQPASRSGGDYERTTGAVAHQEGFEHRVWVTTDGYDSSTYQCSQVWNYQGLWRVNQGTPTDTARVFVDAGTPFPGDPGENEDDLPSHASIGPDWIPLPRGHGSYHPNGYSASGSGTDLHGRPVYYDYRYTHSQERQGDQDLHTFSLRRTIYLYSYPQRSASVTWQESRVAHPTGGNESCSNHYGIGSHSQARNISHIDNGRVENVKITGLSPTITVDSIDAQPREVNNPLTAIGRTNPSWLCDATDPHAQYERGCRIRVDGATIWNAVGQATNVRRHYYAGSGAGGGGTTSINFRAKDAHGNFVEDAGRPRDGFPDPDAAIARAQADTSLSTTRRSEVIRTPRLPHFRTLWWMRKKTSSDWAHLWGQGGLALGGAGWASRGPQPACTGLGGAAPAASGASGAQVACDPDGDLDVNMVQLLTDPAVADRFISEMNERGAELTRWWDAADDAIPDEPWLLGMSDDTFGFACDGRAQRASEWNAAGCYDARHTGGVHDAGLTATQGETFSGERRGDGEQSLNYDIELDLEDADDQPYAYYQQPFDLKSVSDTGAPPFSINNRRLGPDQRRAMSCPWTTDDRVAWLGDVLFGADGETRREAWKCEFDDDLVGNVTLPSAPQSTQPSVAVVLVRNLPSFWSAECRRFGLPALA